MLGCRSLGFVNAKVLRQTKVLEPHPLDSLCELFSSLVPQNPHCTEASSMIHHRQHALTSTYLTLLALCCRCPRCWFFLGNCRVFTLNPVTVNLDPFIELCCFDTRGRRRLCRLLSRIARRADIMLGCGHHHQWLELPPAFGRGYRC